MNDKGIRRALSQANIVHVTDATRIAPHILEGIADGNYEPKPEETDAIEAFFKGEYSMKQH